MTYIDSIEDVKVQRTNERNVNIHHPIVMPKNYRSKASTCMICSMEEGIMQSILKTDKGRKHARRRTHLAVCSDPNCDIICHMCCQEESRMRQIPQFAGLTCFEICHHEDCKDLFVHVPRNNMTYTRSLRNHPVRTLVKELYEADLPRRSERSARGRPPKKLEPRSPPTPRKSLNTTLQARSPPRPQHRVLRKRRTKNSPKRTRLSTRQSKRTRYK